MSEEIKEEIKEEPKLKIKRAEEKPVEKRSDGLAAFAKDGVTIRRHSELESELAKSGWVKK